MLFGAFPLNIMAAEEEPVDSTTVPETAAEMWAVTEPAAGMLSRADLTITDPNDVKGSDYTKSAKMAAALDSIFQAMQISIMTAV